MSGEKHKIKQTPDMRRGTELEPEARSAFEFITEIDVETISLIKSSNRVHCSPDGLTSDGGGLEIKCPIAATQCKYLSENRLPIEYVGQVQHSLMVSCLPHWWFFSYHPKIKPLILKVKPDHSYIKNLQNEVLSFIRDMDGMLKNLE